MSCASPLRVHVLYCIAGKAIMTNKVVVTPPLMFLDYAEGETIIL